MKKVRVRWDENRKCHYGSFWQDGKRHRFKLDPDENKAKIEFGKILAQVESGVSLQQEFQKVCSERPDTSFRPVTLGEMCDKTYDYTKKKKGISPRYLERVVLSNRHLIEVFGKDVEMRNITRKMIGQYKERRFSQDRDIATVNRELSALRRMFNLAVEWGYLPEEYRRFVKLEPERYNIDRSLPENRLNDLLEACRQLYLYLYYIVRFALATGLREGEILNLEWPMINLELGTINIRDRKSGVSSGHLPLNEEARAVLAEVLRHEGCPRVFTDNQGQPINARTLQWHWKRVIRNAGLKGFRFHDLRHTFGTWLAVNGCNEFQIMGLMGHKNLETSKRYIRLGGAHLVKPSHQLSDFIKRIKEDGLENGQPKSTLASTGTKVAQEAVAV